MGEEVTADGERIGQYSYIDNDGKTITVKYTAGKDGFRILEGDHVPIGATGLNSAAFDPEIAKQGSLSPKPEEVPAPRSRPVGRTRRPVAQRPAAAQPPASSSSPSSSNSSLSSSRSSSLRQIPSSTP